MSTKSKAKTLEKPSNVFNPSAYFSSVIYTINKPEFLDAVTQVSNEALDIAKKDREMNSAYPVVMTGSLINHPKIVEFETFIAQAGWTILDSQGYDVSDVATYITELWCQEHFKYSGMEQHVHPYGVMLSGFYFLTTPQDGQLVEIHDPRPGKVQASLKMKDQSKITEANNSVYIKPEPGMFLICNSWLSHSFTRNASDTSCKFIHFNISSMPVNNLPPSSVAPVASTSQPEII